MLIFSIFIMSCSSQEYTTAKLAIQQSDFSKASEWLPKAMEVEPDNPEIPMVMAMQQQHRRRRRRLGCLTFWGNIFRAVWEISIQALQALQAFQRWKPLGCRETIPL